MNNFSRSLLFAAAAFAAALSILPSSPAIAQSATQGINNIDDGRLQVFQNGARFKGFDLAVTPTTATYAVLATDSFITGDATAAGFTATLPAAATAPAGRFILFEKIDASVNAFTISRAASDTINGATSAVLTKQFDFITVESDGVSKWNVVNASNFVSPITAPHFTGNTAKPATPAASTGCNTPSGISNLGNDAAGKVTLTCGGTGSTAATIWSLTFSQVYPAGAAPYCSQPAPQNAATAAIPVVQMPFMTTTTAGLTMTSNATGLATGTYSWSYVCID